jgi:hypothetical protein
MPFASVTRDAPATPNSPKSATARKMGTIQPAADLPIVTMFDYIKNMDQKLDKLILDLKKGGVIP